jgi:hypothetical protein
MINLRSINKKVTKLAQLQAGLKQSIIWPLRMLSYPQISTLHQQGNYKYNMCTDIEAMIQEII